MKEKDNTERINVFFSEKVLAKIRKEALLRGMSVSGFVRMIVMEWVRRTNDEEEKGR